MPFTAKQAKAAAYNNVRTHPFTRIHERPTKKDYNTLKEEASTLACKVEDTNYPWSTNDTGEYGLLADIVGNVKYTSLTGIDTYNEPTKLAA